MTADEARELFSDALEGELDPARLGELQAALARDPALAREYEAFVQTLRRVRGAEAPPAGAPDLLPGVQRRLRERSRGRFYADRFAERRGRGLAQPLLLGLVLLLLLGLSWLGLSLLQHVTLAP